MKCSVCGKENDSSARFCSKCGSPINGGENIKPENKTENIEVDISDEKNNDGSLSTKKYIVVGSIISILIIVCVGLIKYNSKPINKWMKMMKSESYSNAADYYLQVEDKMSTDDINKVRETTINTANEILSKYIKQEIEYTVAINQLNKFQQVDMISDDINSLINEIEVINCSRSDFNTAESLFQSEKYDEALEHYKKVVLSDSDNYQIAQERINDCVNIYRDGILKSVEELKAQEKYSDAFALLNAGMKVLAGDERLSVEMEEINGLIDEKNTTDLIDDVKKSKNDGDIEKAMALISKYEGNNQSAILLKSQIESEYESQIITSVEDLVKAGEIDQAKKKLNDAHSFIPASTAISDWLSIIDDYYPVSLVDMNSLSDENNSRFREWKWKQGEDSDNLGNSDFSGYKYLVDSYSDESLSHTYLIDSKYNVFSGILVTHEWSKDNTKERYWARITIYGDGACLYTSPVTRGGVKPIEFEVDISNVNELTVKLEGSYKLYFGLLNPELKKILSE